MNSVINTLKSKLNNIVPELELGTREEYKTALVSSPMDSLDTPVSTNDRKLYVWKNPPIHIIEYLRQIGCSGPSGNWIYQKGDYQGWHTNSDILGQRLYIAWASESDQSGMRFIIDNQEIYSPDKQGWNIRLFTPPVWHMVYSNCTRASFGFIVRSPFMSDTIQPIHV